MQKLAYLLVILFSMNLFAHEGHGPIEHQTGFWHFIINPTHFLPILAVLVVAFILFRKHKAKKAEAKI